MKPKLIPYGSVYFDYRDNMSIICKEHMMKADFSYHRRDMDLSFITCLEGPHEITLRGHIDAIIDRLNRRINSKVYQDAEYFDIDGYLVPASKQSQIKNKSGEYFVTAQIKSSETKGDQLIIYAGKKGITGKSQIFVDPEHGKLTFDQHDVNPRDVFLKLEATFRDGTTATIDGRKGKEKDES